MSEQMTAEVAEIEPLELERELSEGRPVAILDVREPDAFAAFHLDAQQAELVNLPAALLDADPGAAAALLGSRLPLRVICTAGITSRRLAAAFSAQGVAAASVRGGMIAWSRLQQGDEVTLPGPLRVVQFRREARGCLSYLVAGDGEAVVVDPSGELDPYLAAAARLGVTITRVFETHVHADHLSAARELARLSGARLQRAAGAAERGVSYPFEPLAPGALLSLGRESVELLALPGHTSDMSGLLLGTAALVAGDSLFADAVARPDLESGDAGAPEAARALYATLHGPLAALPDSTLLLPGHYAGGRRAGPLAPSLGEVRAQVAELRLEEDAFVARVLAQMPAKPSNYAAIIDRNLAADARDDSADGLELGANRCAASAAWTGPAAAAA